MEEIMTVFNRFGILIAVAGGGLALVMFGASGILYMMAQGDPQAMGRAKGAFIGALVGCAIVGLAFIIPGIISRVIVEPAGGTALQVDTGDDCDQLLRNQLKFQRGASTAARMQEVIRQIQNQRDACAVELWNPTVNTVDTKNDDCFADITKTGEAGKGLVGNTLVPAGLRTNNSLTENVRLASGRDSDNNIIVYWLPDVASPATDNSSKRPTDNAMCWLFVNRLNSWDESY